MNHNYFVYILTNKNKTVLYTGVTNDLAIRLRQHIEWVNKFAFTNKYNCHFLIYFERYQYIEHAIEREKEIKGWTRAKKNALIEIENKEWKFLNEDILNT
ncbi:GIY-YIG nuclease family protein [Pedobacter punctiformis]|uniref:GIY-YIG nuclease family protein n=1 Tax=Pedobacter punctiformis TaxID=3004097 RepID=A0ABT4L9S5_9SPHI|nr:GIY-YIG nuclease family protein [Pedobacter sp. HCMS5-2]MCZ4244601.1 GIY-YIG nuclease family protein [Pedobacter sp. HCMS5-2]